MALFLKKQSGASMALNREEMYPPRPKSAIRLRPQTASPPAWNLPVSILTPRTLVSQAEDAKQAELFHHIRPANARTPTSSVPLSGMAAAQQSRSVGQ